MKSAQEILFRPFRLDTVNEMLWRGSRVVTLRQKSFTLLRYLAEHSGQLVSKEELLGAVWPETRVSDIVLKVCIREVRQVLGDQPNAPVFIETVQRRGYRFIRPVRMQDTLKVSRQKRVQRSEVKISNQNGDARKLETLLSHAFPVTSPKPLTCNFVGRETELAQLHAGLEKALAGQRQIIFIAGESGLGKTTVLDVFLDQVRADPSIWVIHGQCIAHYGEGEAYLPVFEALTRCCREPGRERLLYILNKYAPLWLAQMPSLLTPPERCRLQREIRGASRERMLREIAEALEALTVEVPLIFILGDLHWSDHATLDLLAFLGRREPARLLMIGTYRPEGICLGAHPLKEVKHELLTHGYCQHISLPLLSEKEVADYIEQRFPHSSLPSRLVRLIHQQTDGNPLFMLNVADYLEKQGIIAVRDGQWRITAPLEELRCDLHTDIQDIIDTLLNHLSSQEEQLLKAASVAGVEFSIAAVAAGLQATVEEVEEWCEALARRSLFLRAQGSEEWPDGTLASRYAFIHSLYQQGWYERVTAAKRVQLHQRLGERQEQGYGERASEIATELAVHFERGRQMPRAVHYRIQAANNALQRFGYQEAATHLAKGLELLPQLPDKVERIQQEIVLQSALGAVETALQGYASPAVERAYARAQVLCQQMGTVSYLVPVLRGLWGFYLARAELRTARMLAEQLLDVARQEQSEALLLEAERELGQTLYFLGELGKAREYLEQSVARYQPEQHGVHAFVYGLDPKIACLAQGARALSLLGCVDGARRQLHTAFTFAQQIAHPYSAALAHYHGAVTYQILRDWRRTQELAEATITIATDHGFPYWQSSASVLMGWAFTQQGRLDEGLALIQQGLADCAEVGAALNRPYSLTLLAEAYGLAGDPEKGSAVLAEALASAQAQGGHFYQAEMLRLRGELLLQLAC